MGHLPNLNSLRFFLASLVAFYHIPQFCAKRGFPYFDALPIFHKGQEAVWVFFSLSGFLIIRQLYHEKSIFNKINLGNFYRNRILRIFPLYYLILLFGFAYYKIILPQFGFPDESNYSLAKGIVLGATFFANFLETFKPGGILEILWSISIEEQFYLLIAPILFFLPIRRALGFFIIFSIAYFLLYHTGDFNWLRKFKMLFYYFSISGILAVLSVKYPNFKFSLFVRILILGSFILYFTTSIFSHLPSILYQLTSAILFPMAIWVLAQKPIRIMENSTLNYFGKISYGIYMYHAILMNGIGLIFLKYMDPKIFPDWFFIVFYNLLVLGSTILVSHLSYQYFEKFFLKKKIRLKY